MSTTYRSRGKLLITRKTLTFVCSRVTMKWKFLHFFDFEILEPVRLQPSPRPNSTYDYQMNEQQMKARQQMAHV